MSSRRMESRIQAWPWGIPQAYSTRAFVHSAHQLCVLAVLMLAAACALTPPAAALTATGALNGVDFSVFAPDWTWQKRDINILVVTHNPGTSVVEVGLKLEFPPGKADHFRYDGDANATFSVPPGDTVRHAFTAIAALDGVPRQLYDFAVVVDVDGETTRVPYPVRTIRGAAVSPGKWALYLPAGIALIWSAVFAVVLPRFARRGAWRTPGQRVRAADHREPWIDQEPS